MGIYLANFLVYSMAMVGLLFVCILVYKKTMIDNRFTKNLNELKVENALNLSQRKTLYVIKAGNEKFLIAADSERTSFLAKLNSTNNTTDEKEELVEQIHIPTNSNNHTENVKVIDYSEVMSAINNTSFSRKKPIMKEILNKLAETSNKQ